MVFDLIDVDVAGIADGVIDGDVDRVELVAKGGLRGCRKRSLDRHRAFGTGGSAGDRRAGVDFGKGRLELLQRREALEGNGHGAENGIAGCRLRHAWRSKPRRVGKRRCRRSNFQRFGEPGKIESADGVRDVAQGKSDKLCHAAEYSGTSHMARRVQKRCGRGILAEAFRYRRLTCSRAQ